MGSWAVPVFMPARFLLCDPERSRAGVFPDIRDRHQDVRLGQGAHVDSGKAGDVHDGYLVRPERPQWRGSAVDEGLRAGRVEIEIG